MKPEAVKDRRWLRVVARKHPSAWSLDRAAQDLNRNGNQPAQMVMPVRIHSNGHQFGVVDASESPGHGIRGYSDRQAQDAPLRFKFGR